VASRGFPTCSRPHLFSRVGGGLRTTRNLKFVGVSLDQKAYRLGGESFQLEGIAGTMLRLRVRPGDWTLFAYFPLSQSNHHHSVGATLMIFFPAPDKARKLLRSRLGSPFGRRPSISWWVRSQIGMALANKVIPLGVRAIKRRRRSPGAAATLTSPRRSNGFNAAVNVVRSIASKEATSAIAGGARRFSDMSNENCPFVRSSRRSAASNRRASARAARCA
jgi:hypothetical protein